MQYLTKKIIGDKHFQRFTYPPDMDEDMIGLMDVINNIPGCRTTYSCQGHGDGCWYFVVYCCNSQIEAELEHYFGDERHLEVISSSMTSPIVNGCLVKEWSIAVYDKHFDKMPASKRKLEYVKMCKHLMQFVPDEPWHARLWHARPEKKKKRK